MTRRTPTRSDRRRLPRSSLDRRRPTTWKHLLIALMASLAPTLASLAGWQQSTQTHAAVNGRVDQLIETAKQLATADALAADRNHIIDKKIQALEKATQHNRELIQTLLTPPIIKPQ